MDDQISVARRAWTFFEPVHAVVYFAPEARTHFDAAGLKGGWMGYFASRSAAMGPVAAAVVVATFHNFQPAMVRRAIPDAWSFSSPERVLEARYAAVDAILRRMWGDVGSGDIREAAELANGVAQHLRPDGRPLYAAHAALQPPSEPHLLLWHACTLLREHRFDGHVAMLTGYGVSGLESLVLATAQSRLDPAVLRRFRGWSEEEWSASRESLQQRGLVDASGALTDAGSRLHAAVEMRTDDLAATVWNHVEPQARDRLLTILRERAKQLEGEGGILYPNPIGVPRPA